MRRHWSPRQWYTILKSDRLSRVSDAGVQRLQRSQRIARRHQAFLRDHVAHQNVGQHGDLHWPYKRAADLEYWCLYGAWTFCSRCHVLAPNKLLNSFTNRVPKTNVTNCPCAGTAYLIPRYSLVPTPLRQLRYNEMCILRPINLHQGEYRQLAHGYR